MSLTNVQATNIFKQFDKSFTFIIKNRKEPRYDPCGIPHLICFDNEEALLICRLIGTNETTVKYSQLKPGNIEDKLGRAQS